MDIKYEPLSHENINEVIKLQQIWVHENITFGFMCDTYEDFAKCINDYSFVAVNDGEVVGFIDAEIKTDNEYNIFPIGSNYLVINDLYVKPEYRNNKIGKRLLALVESNALKNGLINIFLSSATKDSESIRKFYTDNGYGIWTTLFYKRNADDVRIYPLDYLKYYRFVVTYSRYRGKWLYTQHRERTTWECAGGHIEIGETALEAAKRELYEETGAKEFTITPVFDYSVHSKTDFSNGQVFIAEITEIGEIPDPEMAEITLFDTVPPNPTYPYIIPFLFKEIEKIYEKNT